MTNRIVTSLCVLCAFLSAVQRTSAQGPLTPPGAPAPTMITLSQIEPRTPISSAPYTITASGSYYLTTNLALDVFLPGIIVSAPNVTIDLNGFTVLGTNGEGGSAITVPFAGIANLTVRNGSVYDCLNAIDATNATTCLIENVSCYIIFQNAVAVGPGSVVRNCAVERAAASGLGNGILAGAGSIIEHCALFSDPGLANGTAINVGGNCLLDSCVVSNFYSGIVTGNGCTMKASTSSFNVGTGIQVGSGCTIKDCAVSANTGQGIVCGNSVLIAGCTTTSNTGNGIGGGVVCKVVDCVVASNGNGIVLGDHGQVTGCHVNNNNPGITVHDFSLVKDNVVDNNAIGIYVTGLENRIEANNITRGSTGLEVVGSPNLIIRNSISGATSANYNIAANNKLSVVAAPNSGAVTGSSGGSGVGTTDPWANLSY